MNARCTSTSTDFQQILSSVCVTFPARFPIVKLLDYFVAKLSTLRVLMQKVESEIPITTLIQLIFIGK